MEFVWTSPLQNAGNSAVWESLSLNTRLLLITFSNLNQLQSTIKPQNTFRVVLCNTIIWVPSWCTQYQQMIECHLLVLSPSSENGSLGKTKISVIESLGITLAIKNYPSIIPVDTGNPLAMRESPWHCSLNDYLCAPMTSSNHYLECAPMANGNKQANKALGDGVHQIWFSHGSYLCWCGDFQLLILSHLVEIITIVFNDIIVVIICPCTFL